MRISSVQGDTVDAICWRNFGRTAGLVEWVYAHNPGLADLGPVLPESTPVLLPDNPPTHSGTRPGVVQLWS